MKLLVLSKDATLFAKGGAVQGDARLRHARYASILRRRCGDDSEIRLITYTTASSGHRYDEAAPGLTLYGTASAHRALYLLDVLRLLPRVLAGWRPYAVTVQTPWEEGVLGELLARVLGVRFLPQLHFDLFSADWLSEHPLNRWRRFQAQRVLRGATRVRVVSTPLRDLVSSRCGIPPERIDIIPVGVNFTPSVLTRDAAKAAISPDLAGHPVVFFVGRLTAQKNLQLWLTVAREALAQRPEVRFVLAGGGEEDQALQALAVEMGIADAVTFLGPVGYECLPDLYAAADIFLLTSHYEGFGRVVLEAAMAGVPSVATKCSGPEDLIDHGRTGYLLERGDGEALVAAVLDLVGHPDQAARMGGLARDLVQEQFGIDALANRLVSHWSAV